MHPVNRDNLRDFYIEYQNRIIYGTDAGFINDNSINFTVYRYSNTFEILETGQTVNGGFFGNTPIKGLDLPREILEKIYYQNAMRLYPELKTAMEAILRKIQSFEISTTYLCKWL